MDWFLNHRDLRHDMLCYLYLFIKIINIYASKYPRRMLLINPLSEHYTVEKFRACKSYISPLYAYMCVYVYIYIYIYIHIYPQTHVLSFPGLIMWLGLTSREQLKSPECLKYQVLSFAKMLVAW